MSDCGDGNRAAGAKTLNSAVIEQTNVSKPPTRAADEATAKRSASNILRRTSPQGRRANGRRNAGRSVSICINFRQKKGRKNSNDPLLDCPSAEHIELPLPDHKRTFFTVSIEFKFSSITTTTKALSDDVPRFFSIDASRPVFSLFLRGFSIRLFSVFRDCAHTPSSLMDD